MVKFRTYLDALNVKPYQFAVANGLPQVLVWRAYKGIPISPKSAMMIVLACKRRVPSVPRIKPVDLLYPDQIWRGGADRPAIEPNPSQGSVPPPLNIQEAYYISEQSE